MIIVLGIVALIVGGIIYLAVRVGGDAATGIPRDNKTAPTEGSWGGGRALSGTLPSPRRRGQASRHDFSFSFH
ncbi:hypothetical protein [Streptomyces sp. NPDC031705]|uniref:hypothetical protein n=1 Tax=Streptomyces sp. NPDC031705 TaxID=3155729 RepID=UPI0033CCAC29